MKNLDNNKFLTLTADATRVFSDDSLFYEDHSMKSSGNSFPYLPSGHHLLMTKNTSLQRGSWRTLNKKTDKTDIQTFKGKVKRKRLFLKRSDMHFIIE